MSFQLRMNALNKRISDMKTMEANDLLLSKNRSRNCRMGKKTDRDSLLQENKTQERIDSRRFSVARRHHKKRVAFGEEGDAFQYYFGDLLIQAKKVNNDEKVEKKRSGNYLSMPRRTGTRRQSTLSLMSRGSSNHNAQQEQKQIRKEPEAVSSQSDDKAQPNYWRKNQEFF